MIIFGILFDAMDTLEDLSIYLPKYLSEESTKILLEELKQFPVDGTKKTIYTCALDESPIIYQGDGLKELEVISLPDESIRKTSVIILSNTCDVDTDNKRFFPSRMCYAPIIDLDKYQKMLLLNGYSEQQVNSHVEDIKKQVITQIFYLPRGSGLAYDGIVFLDRINNISNQVIDRNELQTRRIFTLSDYGYYLFLLKISIHFSRVQEKIDRNKGIDISSLS